MNDYVFKYILKYLFSEINESNKNILLNAIEEYIEWMNYSEFRFKKDYSYYKEVMQKCQVNLLLNEYEELKTYISDELINIDISTDEGDII